MPKKEATVEVWVTFQMQVEVDEDGELTEESRQELDKKLEAIQLALEKLDLKDVDAVYENMWFGEEGE